MKSQKNIKVYYDGLCKICSTEINHYRKQTGSQSIEFVDICGENFNAAEESLDPVQVHKIMHVRRMDGSIAIKVDAFIEIWSALPKYKFLSILAKNRAVRSSLDASYSVFAFLRPWLPRYSKNEQCKDSPFCEVKNG